MGGGEKRPLLGRSFGWGGGALGGAEARAGVGGRWEGKGVGLVKGGKERGGASSGAGGRGRTEPK
eukprot:scaffold2554_cov93-Isochrysis_galbana.AAC.2